MPRDGVHYQGTLIELAPRALPNGGWLEWDVTYRGPDGTRHPVTRMRATVDQGALSTRHLGGRAWRFTLQPPTSSVAQPVRNRLRSRRDEPTVTSQVTVTAEALIDNEWVRIARQVVLL